MIGVQIRMQIRIADSDADSENCGFRLQIRIADSENCGFRLQIRIARFGLQIKMADLDFRFQI